MPKYSPEELKNLNYSSLQLIKDVWELLRPYKWRFFFATLIRLSGDLANLIPTFVFATLVTFLTKYHTGDSLKPVYLLIATAVGATVVRNLSQGFSKYFGYSLGQKIYNDSYLKAIKHMFMLDMAWHEKENSGNKIKRIENAGGGFNRIMRLYFDDIIEIIVNIIAINFIIYKFDHKVLVLLVIFLIIYFFISHFLMKRASLAAYRVNKQDEVVNGLLFEAINNIRTVKVMAMAFNMYNLISKEMDEFMERVRIRIKWFQFRGTSLSLFANIFRLGIFLIIAYGISQGHYEVGFLVLFNGYFSSLRESIDELANDTQEFIVAKLSVSRMKEIINEPINIDVEEGKKSFPKNWQKISFKNVSFSYGDNEVLEDISLEMNKGDKVGIVGLSGAGKSTLFKLLLKEREASGGDILFDDISIKEISKNDYFKKVSVVLQDTEVFNFSLEDNITITNDKNKNNKKLLNQALNIAHITDFLNKLPKGLDTLIGEKGIKLSGGERQRLGIARAIFKEPEILLLDEATSHLDLESEEKIKDSLHQFFENVTAIVIAHRLTTVKEMDKILVIEDGRVVESGNFEELYKSKGRFYELWEKQKI